MILITGNEPIVDGVCSALDSLGGRWLGARTFDAPMTNRVPAPP
jgi:hypothetical protein